MKSTMKSHNITLNYPEIRVDNPQIKTDNLGISIHATYIGKPNEPNVIYSTNSIPKNYQAENLFIYSKLHNLPGLDHDGELIIKNKSHTSQQIIYTIFLLKTSKSIGQSIFPSALDKLLSHPTKSTYLEIHTTPDKYIVYTDKSTNQIVIIDTTIINVAEDLSKYSKNQAMFRISKEYDIVKSDSMIKSDSMMKSDSMIKSDSMMKSVEGFSLDLSGTLMNDNENGDYLICDNLPIDSTEELNYIIPQSSDVVDLLSESNYMNSIMNYIVCFVLFIIIFFFSSYFYDWIFTPNTPFFFMSAMGLTKFVVEKMRIGKRSHICLLITIITFILFMIFITVGPTQNIPLLTSAGIGLALSYMVSVLAITNNEKLQGKIKSRLDEFRV